MFEKQHTKPNLVQIHHENLVTIYSASFLHIQISITSKELNISL
jgi:hypothetical protein